jgi:hypothetical protein
MGLDKKEARTASFLFAFKIHRVVQKSGELIFKDEEWVLLYSYELFGVQEV